MVVESVDTAAESSPAASSAAISASLALRSPTRWTSQSTAVVTALTFCRTRRTPSASAPSPAGRCTSTSTPCMTPGFAPMPSWVKLPTGAVSPFMSPATQVEPPPGSHSARRRSASALPLVKVTSA